MGDVLRPGSARSAVAMVTALLLLAGCQTPQQQPLLELRPSESVARAADSRPLRAIAVVGASYLPEIRLGDLAPARPGGAVGSRNSGKDAAMGAAVGASVGAAAGLAVLAGMVTACINPAAPATCTAFWSFVGSGALVGGAAGIALGQKSGAAPESAAGVAVRETPLQDVLRAAVASRCVPLTTTVCAETHFPGPGARGARTDYAPLWGTPAEAVLEVEVLDLVMDGSSQSGALALRLIARAQLVRAPDGVVLYRGVQAFRSESLPVDDWVANNAEKFREVLQRGFSELAGRIVDAALVAERRAG